MTSTNRKTAKTTTTRTGSKLAAARITANHDPRRRTRRASDNGKRDAGRAGAVTTAEARPTKQAAILNLLRRAKGASIDDLTSATGWQAHSVRAALTGLRKRGHDIERSVESGASRYRIIEKRKAARS
jgi:biotin operon repressor